MISHSLLVNEKEFNQGCHDVQEAPIIDASQAFSIRNWNKKSHNLKKVKGEANN